jgi:hypothetical protein
MSSIETSLPSTQPIVPGKKDVDQKKQQYIVYTGAYREDHSANVIVNASSEEKVFEYLVENWREYVSRPELEDIFIDVVNDGPKEWKPQSETLIDDAFSGKVLEDQDQKLFDHIVRQYISASYEIKRHSNPIKIVTV